MQTYTVEVVPIDTSNPVMRIVHADRSIAFEAAADYAGYSDVSAVSVTDDLTGEVIATFQH